MLKNYDKGVLWHPCKTKIVVDAFIRLSMSSVAYVEDEKKELFFDVHMLDILSAHLVNSVEDSMMVLNIPESSLVVVVKAK